MNKQNKLKDNKQTQNKSTLNLNKQSSFFLEKQIKTSTRVSLYLTIKDQIKNLKQYTTNISPPFYMPSNIEN